MYEWIFLSSVEQTMFQYYVKVVPTTYVDVKGKVSSLYLLKDNYHHLHNNIIFFFNRFYLFSFWNIFYWLYLNIWIFRLYIQTSIQWISIPKLLGTEWGIQDCQGCFLFTNYHQWWWNIQKNKGIWHWKLLRDWQHKHSHAYLKWFDNFEALNLNDYFFNQLFSLFNNLFTVII